MLETSKKDVEFRKYFVYCLAGTLEPPELQRRRQRSMVEEEKLRERVARLNSTRRAAVLDRIMASEKSLDRFAEIELMKYRKSRQASPEEESTGKELSGTEIADVKRFAGP